MGIFLRKLEKRRKTLMRDIETLQNKRDMQIQRRLTKMERISKNLSKRQKRDINLNPSLQLDMNQGAGCPFFSNNREHEEPFGWSKGTVRGMITLWTVLAFLIGFILGYIPILIAAPIFTAIIISYFIGRARMY